MDKMLNVAIAGMLATIGLMIGLIVVTGIVTPLFPQMITAVVGLSTLGNFTFSSLFGATGFVPILLSVFVLLLVIGLPIGAVVLTVAWIKAKGNR